ncbi:MAG: NifU family protein [Planctomycetota bacterium]|nr:NifU family protein [Planctomycetota bacterium]
MNSNIAITANPSTVPSQCKFVVDRPICDGAFYFGNSERAKGSQLAERLFGITGVDAVLIAGTDITVTKASPEDWQTLGRQIGAAIRAHFESGDESVSNEFRMSLPSEDEIRDKVEVVLETDINPSIASHGGVVNLVDVRGNTVFLQMGGGCQGCSSATATLKSGVEVAIRRAVPGVGEILDQTDHAAGRNPYYATAR